MFLYQPPTISQIDAMRTILENALVPSDDSSCLRLRSQWNPTERSKLNRMFNVRNATKNTNGNTGGVNRPSSSAAVEHQEQQQHVSSSGGGSGSGGSRSSNSNIDSSSSSSSSSSSRVNNRGAVVNEMSSTDNINSNTNNSSSSSSSSSNADDVTSISGIQQEVSLSMRYRQMKEETLTRRIRVKRSGIHGWGVFARRDIAVDEIIAEYVGEAVRPIVADRRENEYDRQHTEGGLMGGCYMFRVDQEEIIDATRKGNHARFINHSCSANAYARIGVLPDMSSHIFVFALRKIFKGEEVTYDYQFPLEDNDQLECNCGAWNCKKRMN